MFLTAFLTICYGVVLLVMLCVDLHDDRFFVLYTLGLLLALLGFVFSWIWIEAAKFHAEYQTENVDVLSDVFIGQISRIAWTVVYFFHMFFTPDTSYLDDSYDDRIVNAMFICTPLFIAVSIFLAIKKHW